MSTYQVLYIYVMFFFVCECVYEYIYDSNHVYK